MRIVESMERKTSAYYQRRHRERLREMGLVKKELWILPEFAEELAAVERRMRQPRGSVPTQKEIGMNEPKVWTASALHEALAATDAVRSGAVSVELLDGAEPSLHLVMHDYGDLPVFLAVVGEQVIVEALMWPVSQVKDAVAFNEEVLRTHKLFPLSTIGIEVIDGDPVYIMFGALDASSSLSNVVFEVDTLADNVISVTEAFESRLRDVA